MLRQAESIEAAESWRRSRHRRHRAALLFHAQSDAGCPRGRLPGGPMKARCDRSRFSFWEVLFSSVLADAEAKLTPQLAA